MRSLELQVSDSKSRDLPCVERAFNVLAHADLRNCYDALCKNENAAPLFPYGGFGYRLRVRQPARHQSSFFAYIAPAPYSGITSRHVNLLCAPSAVFCEPGE